MISKFQMKGELTCPNCHVERQPFTAGGDLRLHPRPEITIPHYCTTPDCHTKFLLTFHVTTERIEKDRAE